MPATSSERNIETLTFFPMIIPFPKTTTKDYLCQSVGDILGIINQPKTQLPFLIYGDDTINAIRQIAILLHRAVPAPAPVIPTAPAPVPLTTSSTPTVTPTLMPTPAPPRNPISQIPPSVQIAQTRSPAP